MAIELDVKYEAFVWTGGEDQAHDPVWIVNYLKSNKAYIRNDPKEGLYMKGLPGIARPGDVIVFNGRKYSENGGVSFYNPIAFKVFFGESEYNKLF